MPALILVLDDDPAFAEIIRCQFEQEVEAGEFQFEFRLSAQAGLDFLSSHPDVKIVLTDLNMPGMDGITFLSKLRETRPELQKIVISGYQDMGKIRLAMNQGAFDFLCKPILINDLKATLSKALEQVRLVEMALENGQRTMLMNRELAIAAEIQDAILPKAFSNHGEYELYARINPARVVSGDFFDYYTISKYKVGVVIGDVSGKGMPAAIFMAFCQAFLRSLVKVVYDPGALVSSVNQNLCEINRSGLFVTLFYGVLDLKSKRLDYVNAGHPHPMILRGNGALAPLAGLNKGALVGLFPEEHFLTQSVTLAEGDFLVAFTDGILESKNKRNELFGENGVSTLLQSRKFIGTKKLADSLLRAVKEFSFPNENQDDQSVLVLRKRIKIPGEGPGSDSGRIFSDSDTNFPLVPAR